MAPPLTILIDLDGTLMDTVPDLAAAANRMRRDFGLPPLPVRRIGRYVGKGTGILIHRTLSDDLDGRVDERTFLKGRESFNRHYHEVNGRETAVFEGVRDGLRALAGAGLKLACVTNKPREFTLPLLERLGLSGWFAQVVTGDDVKALKPDPEPLLEACRRLGCRPSEALMIGDSANDLRAAQAAGMTALLVETGYNEGAPLASLEGEAGLEGIVATLRDAADRLLAPRKP